MSKYDITIIGGGTAGCACAYIASKLGLKVLLIEKKSYLGGSITGSLVIPAMKTSNKAINNDFYNNLYNELHKLGGAITYSDGNKGWINPELTKIILDKMMNDAKVNVLLETNIENINDNLSSYTVTLYDDNTLGRNNKLLSYIDTKFVVDATGDAKICRMLNCDLLTDRNYNQPISLRFIMSGVNVKLFSDWIIKFDGDRNITTSCISNGNIHLSTAYTWDTSTDWALRPLFQKAVDDGVLIVEDTNYFQIFTVAGAYDSIAFNCPRILNNKLSHSEAYVEGRKMILRLSQFCIKYLPGFENAYISSIADNIGVRESYRVKGKYVYTKNDLVSGKIFDNPVIISDYPIDIHSSEKDTSILEKVYQEYSLPIESLMVKDNLFVIGRCISAEFEAQAALRIIPSCFSMGEGLAKYLAKSL